MKICSVEACVRPHHARAYCKAHYKQIKHTGTVKPLPPIGWRKTKPIKIIDGVVKKWCPQCAMWVTLGGFRKNATRKDGLHSSCKSCENNSRAAWQRSAAGQRSKKRSRQRRRALQKNCPTYHISDRDMKRLLSLNCAYEDTTCCGYLTIEHIIPLSRGGSHGIGNLTRLCVRHNSSKGSKTHMEYVVEGRRRRLQGL